MITPYLIHLAILIGIYTILGAGLNLSVGFTGMFNLGHVAFFGLGAYTSALLARAGVPFPLALLTASTVAACFACLLALATRRLKGDYLALATLGFSFVTYSVFLNWTSLTRGPLGIPGIPKPVIFELSVTSPVEYLLLTLFVAVLVLTLLSRLVSSPYGRALEAVRDDAVALSALGQNVFKLKAQSLSLSAALAGLSGSLYAHYLTYIDPSSFFLSEIILVLTIVMVGGLASLRGTVLAAVIILLIPEFLRFLALPSSMIGPARQMIYAGLLIGILMFRPRGLLGRVDLT